MKSYCALGYQPLLHQASLKSGNSPSPPLLDNSPLYIVFWDPLPLKNQIFQQTPIIFPSFNLSHLTNFIVKISQFKVLVMTEKKLFINFCCEIFQIIV